MTSRARGNGTSGYVRAARRGGVEAYVGPDRRGVAHASRGERRRTLVAFGLAALTVVGLATVTATVALVAGGALASLFRAGTGWVGLGASVLLVVLTRLHHRAAGLAIGRRMTLAAVALACASIGTVVGTWAGSGIGSLGPDVHLRADLLRSYAVVLAGVATHAALRAPDVDTRRLLAPTVTTVLVALVGAVGLLVLPEATATVLSVTRVDHLAATLVWWGVALASLRDLRRRADPLAIATVWVAALVGLGEVLRVASAPMSTVATTGALLQGLSVLLLAGGATVAIARLAEGQRSLLQRHRLRHRAEGTAVAQRLAEDAHDVRNALVTIEGATATLHRHGADLAPRDRASLRDAVESGIDHLRRVVDEMTAPSPISSPTGPAPTAPPVGTGGATDPIPRADRDPPEVEVHDLLRRAAASARATGLHVEVTGGPASVRVPPTALRRVVDNLLANVRRHAGHDHRPTARIDVGTDQGMVVVTVDDDGPGIRAPDRGRIFERGTTVGPTDDGDGLGLHIARSLARTHDGELWATTAPTGGARFVLTLPGTDGATSDAVARPHADRLAGARP